MPAAAPTFEDIRYEVEETFAVITIDRSQTIDELSTETAKQYWP